MLKKLVLLTGLLLTSLSAPAALISHFGYERDSASNIVTGGGLEWLKWDVTKGMSINSALSSYASQGWRLASNVEMALLFNQFKFGKSDWQPNEGISQDKTTPWNSDEFSLHNDFIRLFGATQHSSCSTRNLTTNCRIDTDPHTATSVYFGADLNKNGLYNIASVRDDSVFVASNGSLLNEMHYAVISYDGNWPTYFGETTGVALVRNYVPGPVAVPTPGSIGLLALGLVALGYRRRQVLGR